MKITQEMIRNHFIVCSDCGLEYIPMELKYQIYCPKCDHDGSPENILTERIDTEFDIFDIDDDLYDIDLFDL